MNIEHLKLILQMVEGVTDGAIWIAIIYFLLPLAKTALVSSAWITFSFIVFKAVKHLVVTISESNLIHDENGKSVLIMQRLYDEIEPPGFHSKNEDKMQAIYLQYHALEKKLKASK